MKQVILFAICMPLTALASEDEKLLSLEGGYQYVRDDETSGHGADVSANLLFGVNQHWWLGGGLHAGATISESFFIGSANLSAAYTFDVLKYVPYARIDLGGTFVSKTNSLRPTAALTFGLDKLSQRSRSFGFFATVRGGPSSHVTAIAGARLFWRWGFF